MRHWQDDGACRGQDRKLWFPAPGDEKPAYREAKAICATCPVREECLTFALATDERHGLWGGLTIKERHRWRDRSSGTPEQQAARAAISGGR